MTLTTRQILCGFVLLSAMSGPHAALAQALASPVVTAVSPLTGAVGTVVTLRGTSFTGANVVSFGGTASVMPTAVTATSLHAVVPEGASTGRVEVTTPGGTGTSASTFTVVPTIGAFTPTSALPGESVTVTGFNLVSGGVPAMVQVGQAPVTVTNASLTSLTFTIPTAAATGRILVRTPDGTATSARDLVIIRPPTITALSPAASAPR
jgi:hypothetical protein